MYLNGAKFSTPSSEMVETKAMGLGTMPLIISLYSSLEHNVQVALIDGIGVGALQTIVLSCVDRLPSLLLAFQPCPTRRRTVHLLAIRPRRVRWFGEFGLAPVVEGREGHLQGMVTMNPAEL